MIFAAFLPSEVDPLIFVAIKDLFHHRTLQTNQDKIDRTGRHNVKLPNVY